MAGTANPCETCGELKHPGIIWTTERWSDTDGVQLVQRCDACERYPSDRAAAHVLADLEGLRFFAAPDFYEGPPATFAGVVPRDWEPPADWPADWETLDRASLRRRTPAGRAMLLTAAHMLGRCPDCHVLFLDEPDVRLAPTSMGRMVMLYRRRCDHCDRTWETRFLPSTLKAIDHDGSR